ncbi:MAG: hypothetical protein QM722_23670 [Piscinibacter sp.]
MIASIDSVMKGANSRSMTGRRPMAAAPAAVPAMMASASGVLRTRAGPNSASSSWRLVATPSPNISTRGSRRISSARACETASLTVRFCMVSLSFVSVVSGQA